MTDNNLEVGHTVKLNSGGPLMTVDSIAQYSGVTKVRCMWFDEAETKYDNFPPATLTKEE